MSDVLFVQFWSPMPEKGFLRGRTDLGNGFSDTLDLCSARGDLVWLRYPQFSERQRDGYFNMDLPIRKGTVYVSAIYFTHLQQSYVWALKYPDISFVVGGPAACCPYELTRELPNNLTITNKSVEQWFGVPDFSGRWRLRPPEDLQGACVYSYTLDNTCYWSKCSFCIRPGFTHKLRDRKSARFECADAVCPGKRIIQLNTESISPRRIRETIPVLPHRDHIEFYSIFLRPTKMELAALKETLEPDGPPLRFIMGIEFPSQRMWDLMHKGYRKEEVIETVRLLAELGVRMQLNFIVGWDDLIADDLDELEAFMAELPRWASIGMGAAPLFAYVGTELYRTRKPDRIVDIGPFRVGFFPRLTSEQVEINQRAREIIVRHGQDFDLYMPC